MFHRLLRSTIVLGVLIAAYEAYTTFAVPLMEPELALKAHHPLAADDHELANQAVTKYQRLLSVYFPKNHWTQTRPPKVIANSTEKAMLVFDAFKRRSGSGKNADGSPTTLVDIDQIVFLMFPTPPREGITPPRDAIILEAAQGAHLEFDEFRPEVGKIGQILRGEFPGPIRIHSDMKEPGPEDDLLVEVSDLVMNTKLLYTSQPNSPVRFRMGQNVGGGTDLEIRFLADDHFKANDPGLKIAGFDSLEIRRNVKMRLQLDTASLLPGGKAEGPGSHAGLGKEHHPSVQVTDTGTVQSTPSKPPVDVACSGPFTFDFVRYVASLDRDVKLVQANPNGPSDQLACSRLDIHFAPKVQPNALAQPVILNPGKRQQQELGRLEAVAVIAEGHPAVMTSPANNAQVRGDRIQVAIKEQRIRVSGGSDAMLVEGSNVLQAPVIDYQHPTRDEGTAIGLFRATGPGTLHYVTSPNVTDPTRPQQVLNASWQTSVQLGREKGQPVLALDGRPKIAFTNAGSLSADQIRLYLRELDGKSNVGIAISGGNGDRQQKVWLAPDRLLAVGHVEIASPQFTGRAQSLAATFHLRPAVGANSGKPDKSASSSNATSTTSSTNSTKTEAKSSFNVAPASAQPQPRYYIDTDEIQLDVSMSGQSAVPTALACNGHVLLREIPLEAADQQPLEIRGGQLLVDHLETKSPHATLHGIAPGQAPGTALAQLAGRGVTMLVDTVEVDQGENRMWSKGPGKATLLMARDLAGNPSTSPIPLELTWQGGVKFDGQTMTFQRDVSIDGADTKVNCDELSAKLAAPIKVGQHVGQSATSPSEIECRGRVTIENVQRDAGGLTSHEQIQLARLLINQQTGAIRGDGPGVIRATQFGSGMAAISGQPVASQQAAVSPLNPAGNKLYFLRVDFHQGLEGNIYTREVTFHERVRSIYGPVDSWEQELDPSRPETLPPDTITLTSEQLRLNEDPVAARAMAAANGTGKRPMGPIQMQAQEDVRITGQVPNQGEFSVEADRASYDRSKDVFILEGDGRTPAKLWRRTATGMDAPPVEARKLMYFRSRNDFKIDSLQYLEITPSDLQNARRPTPVR